jgi:hypothetical protein
MRFEPVLKERNHEERVAKFRAACPAARFSLPSTAEKD